MAATQLAVVPFCLLDRHRTSWDPTAVDVALNVTVDGAFVSCAGQGGLRVDLAHLVVLDNLLDDGVRQELLDSLTEPGWDHTRGPPTSKWERATCDQGCDQEGARQPPRTWGLKDGALKQLAASSLPAKLEVQSRLCKLYPEYDIAHMPSDYIQHDRQPQPQQNKIQRPWQAQQQELQHAQQPQQQGQLHQQPPSGPMPISSSPCAAVQSAAEAPTAGASGPSCVPSPAQVPTGSQAATINERCTVEMVADDSGPSTTAEGREDVPQDPPSSSGSEEEYPKVDCNQFVANAAVFGDAYSWHQDADPSCFPPSPWTRQFGSYIQREPGKPLLVSLLVYLSPQWPREWDAETLFLDTGSDTGVMVRPKPGRVVLMDQDVLHRLSAPSEAAGQPRYSLVWKLVFLPKHPGQDCCISRPDWGRPTAFGSAARVDAALEALRQQRKRSAAQAHEGDDNVKS